MNNIFVISSLIASLICWLLGFSIYVKNRHTTINKSFSLLLLSIGIWTLFPFVTGFSPDKKTALFMGRFVYLAAIFTPSNFYWAISVALGISEHKKNKIIITVLYLTSCLFLLVSFSNLFIKGICRFQPNFFAVPGLFYPIFILFFGCVCLMTFWHLYNAFKTISGAYKNQIKYILASFFTAFIGGIFHVFAPYINLELIPHDIFIISFAIIITYAIVRYRLMDINIAIRNVLTYLAEVIVLSIFLFILLAAFGFKEIFPAILSSLGIATGLIPLRTGIRRFIDKVIFKGKYNYQKKLAEITNTVPTIIDQDKLFRYVLDNITDAMHAKYGVIFLKDDRRDIYNVQHSVGFDNEVSTRNIDGKSELIKWLKEQRDVVLKYELYQLMNPSHAEELWSEVNTFNSELIVPLHKGENLIGFLSLSHKGGGDVFNQDDFRILQTIVNQVAVVIENIRLYNKLIHTDRQTFLETLASGVSHEMRNRLVAIRTFIDLFPERVDLNHVEKGFIEFRELAVREMARLTKIIDGLLSYSRAVSIGGETLNLNDLIEEALLIIQPKVREKEINLKTNLDKNISSLIGDKGRLLQVFINIIQNAIDAMKKGGRLEIISIDKVEDIEVYIIDNGKGIPKEHLDAIFEPFFTTKHTGTGLGLSIVQRIVRDHSGRISVKSEVGKGTTFTITFPKKGSYILTDAIPKEGLRYWDVKKEYEAPEDESSKK